MNFTKAAAAIAGTLALAAFTQPGWAAEPAAAPQPQAVWKADVTGSRTDKIPLLQLVPGGGAQAIRLTGTNNVQALDFGVRADEIVSGAQLSIQYTPSPSLIPTWSQLNISLNGQLQKSLPVGKEQPGRIVRETIELNPKQIRSQNRLTLEFIGHYQSVCESRANETLWLALDSSSSLSLTRQKLRVANDLSKLPAPFVDNITSGKTVLPFVFAGTPGDSARTAAAVMASWCGRAADWRRIEFPVYYGAIPAESNFVVFATNDDRPQFLSDIPKFDGPEVFMADVPGTRAAKMLVIAGRNDAELTTAARALASSKRVLIGEKFRVRNFKEPAKRAPYDAPRWLDTTRPVPFSELMQYPQQLTSRGYSISPVHLPVRLAPDLFSTGTTSIDMDLAYRYTKPGEGDSAQLQVRINGYLADSVNLSAEEGTGEAHVRIPKFVGALAGSESHNPVLRLVNDLSFEVGYNRSLSEGSVQNCRSVTIRQSQMEIDPGSTINLKNLYHYAQLPDLSLYGQGGFPFTRMADLSETVALMPADATAAEISTLLSACARFAQATGLPVLGLTVTSQVKADALKGKDILAIGPVPAQMPPEADQSAGLLQESVKAALTKGVLSSKAVRDQNEDSSGAKPEGGYAAIVSLESPFEKGRTVVALLSEGTTGAQLLNRRLAAPETGTRLGGSVSVMNSHEVMTFSPGSFYRVGALPWYQTVWMSVANHPAILVACALLSALLIGVGLLFFMRLIVRGRQ